MNKVNLIGTQEIPDGFKIVFSDIFGGLHEIIVKQFDITTQDKDSYKIKETNIKIDVKSFSTKEVKRINID